MKSFVAHLCLPSRVVNDMLAIAGKHDERTIDVYLDTLTLSLPRSSIDDLVFSVFTSNFFKLSYKICLLKNRFVTLFFIRFS